MAKHLLKPVEEPLTTEVAEILGNYPQRDGYILQLFRVFANSLRFLRKGTVNLLDRESPLSMREREIVILRTSANNDCEYEWGVHVTAFAEHVGLSDAQIAATRTSAPDAPCWNEKESLLVRVVDELCEEARISDATYERFQENWDCNEQLEIMALCGNYHTISFVANTTRLDNESFAASFP